MRRKQRNFYSFFCLRCWQWFALLYDIWHKEKLRKQLDLASESGAELIYASYSLFDKHNELYRSKAYLVPSIVTYKSMLRENYIGCSAAMIKRDVLVNHMFSEHISRVMKQR